MFYYFGQSLDCLKAVYSTDDILFKLWSDVIVYCACQAKNVNVVEKLLSV